MLVKVGAKNGGSCMECTSDDSGGRVFEFTLGGFRARLCRGHLETFIGLAKRVL